jgi:exopolyphosphatase/guanosine-5'-triphosphate,3'-diphosphate pyrophosphatase
VLARDATVTGLARGVDAGGILSPRAVDETRSVLAGYRAVLDRLGVERVRSVATSACRDAVNGPETMALFAEVLGVRPEIITGDREASLAFAGATSGVRVDGRRLVVDVGGGSTEIVEGDAEVSWSNSYDIGSVRLTDRVLRHRPPREGELDEAAAEVADVLSRPPVPVRSDRIIGVAGTFTSLAAIHLDLPAYDRSEVHGASMTGDEVISVLDHLASLDVEATARIPSLQAGRAPVILAGAVVVAGVMDVVGAREVVVSETDLLDAVAAELLV